MPRLLWTNRSNFGPSPRSAAAMCFDSARNRTVLFGGEIEPPTGISSLGDTWEWDGAFWTQMEDTGPSPRRASAMVYDSTRNVSVLFGGTDKALFGDTWQWDGTGWTKLSESGPTPRARMAMAFDSTRNRIVLFAGESADAFHLGDTWEFDGNDWTQVQDSGPPVRSTHVMTFDPVSQRVILFGGIGEANASLGDTWAWNGKEWVQLAEFGPPPRLNAAMASTSGGGSLLFGGLDVTVPQTIFSDTWEFDGKRWIQRQDIGPGPLHSASIAFDSNRSSVVLFGGQPPRNPGDPASRSGLTWESPVAAATPPPPVVVPPNAALRLVNIGIAGGPRLFGAIGITFTLSGPAAQGGTVVQINDELRDTHLQDLHSVTIPAGLTTHTFVAEFKNAGNRQLSAGVALLNEALLDVEVGL